MTRLLLRLFVKNAADVNDPATRAAVGKLAGVVGIVCNLLLVAGKLTVGILTGAVSVVADAMNNLSDAASSVITVVGFRLAQRPADHNHPYGHARYEYLSGLAVAGFVFMVGGELIASSAEKIFRPGTLNITPVSYAILLASAALKLWLYIFDRKLGKMIRSGALAATASDCRNDVLATTAVLAGCVISDATKVNVDGYIGLAVALFILYSGYRTARETISPLIGKGADRELVEKVTEVILSHEKILGIHDLLVHDYGPGQCFASVHAEMSAEEDPLVCHDIIDDIECDLMEQLNVHLVIHYDPVVVGDPQWDALRHSVRRIVAAIDPALSIHDFRLLRTTEQVKIAFDLAVPYGMKRSRREMKDIIDEKLAEQGICYPTVIRFEKTAE